MTIDEFLDKLREVAKEKRFYLRGEAIRCGVYGTGYYECPITAVAYKRSCAVIHFWRAGKKLGLLKDDIGCISAAADFITAEPKLREQLLEAVGL